MKSLEHAPTTVGIIVGNKYSREEIKREIAALRWWNEYDGGAGIWVRARESHIKDLELMVADNA